MALISCSQCEGKISDKAKICPHCNHGIISSDMSNSVDFKIESDILVRYNGNNTNVTIPQGITKIGDSAFFGNPNVESITLPNSLTSIGYDAFHFCSNLKEIVIPDSVHTIWQEAFSNCTNLKSVRLSEKITEIGYHQFFLCTMLKKINIPDVVIKIREGAFNACNNLENILIPKTVKQIGKGAFKESGLINIEFEYGLEEIEENAFCACGNLIKIVFPKSLKKIGRDAFWSSSNLSEVYISNSVTEIGANAFKYCDKVTVIAPKGSYAEYYARTNNIPFSVGQAPKRGIKNSNSRNSFWDLFRKNQK